MARKSSYDIEAMRRAMTLSCPACGGLIEPRQMLRVDGERIRCPHCAGDFDLPGKGTWTQCDCHAGLAK